MVVLVDDDSYLFPFFVLCRHVDVFLFPVDVHFELDVVVELGLEDEVVEPSADEGVGLNVGVGHVVLGTDLLLPPLNELGLR